MSCSVASAPGRFSTVVANPCEMDAARTGGSALVIFLLRLVGLLGIGLLVAGFAYGFFLGPLPRSAEMLLNMAFPVMGLLGVFLVFLAVAGILARLDKIVMSNADTADAVEDLLKHLKSQTETGTK